MTSIETAASVDEAGGALSRLSLGTSSWRRTWEGRGADPAAVLDRVLSGASGRRSP